jgi:DNA-binding ferritin-like protein
MFDTRNDLPANTRTKVIELLNARLADAIDLGDNDKDLWFLEAHLHAKR